jgi:uridine kinase
MEYFKGKKLKMTGTPSIRRRSIDIIQHTVSNIEFKGRKTVFVGISGGPASGKTKISQYFHNHIKRSDTICEMSFFNPSEKTRNITKENEYLIRDYDNYSKKRRLLLIDICNPYSYDYDKFYETLKGLSEGKKMRIPYFNEEKGEFEPEKDKDIDPSKTPLIIVDGYFIFKDQRIKDFLNLKIFKEVEEDVRLSRLVLREDKYLKRDKEAYKIYFDIYEKFYKMSYGENIEVYKKAANILLPDYCINEDNQLEGDETLEFLLTNLTYLSKR